ncbi:YaaL family protein [Scopulibacillus cellulosilyticus]|uniref:YaaL family protein n=1 Tax=Scopulibacillus cellulosilyticus TaxID=2665665 RepID=A0ABW2PZ17_9BACL
MFKRKKKLRKEINEQLLNTLTKCKNDWLRQKRIIEGSIEPSEEVIYQLRLSEAKYLFLLKEIRYLNLSFNQKQ